MGEQVRKAERKAQGGDAGDHQVCHHPTQVQVPVMKDNISVLGKSILPDSILVKLLNGFFEPPVRPHEGQSHCDLGVHRTQCPVLRGNICGQVLSKGNAAVKVLPAKGSRSGSGGVAL